MKGGHIIAHYSFTMTEHEGATFRHLLAQVEADDEFPLNEGEEELVAKFLEVLRPSDEEASVT